MKKYFRNIRTLAALVLAASAFVACSNDDGSIEQQPVVDAEQVYTLTINATKGDDATTRALKLETNGALTAYWENGDQVYVMKENSLGSVGTLTASNANGATATFSGKINSTVKPNDVLTLYYHFQIFSSYKGQTGTLASASEFDIATATVTVADINNGNITIKETEGASFATQTAMIKLTLIEGNQKFNATSLKVSVDGEEIFTFSPSAATYTANGNGILYFALPSADAMTVTLSKTKEALAAAPVTFTVSNGSKTYTVTKQGYIFAAGKYYTSTLATFRDGALSGMFSVGSSNKVRFSKGNLQYQASTNTWRFAEHQYDYIGSANSNISATNSGWIDLFAWGTSGYNHGATNYQPWSIASSGYDAYGDANNNLYNGNGKADWGYNAISNGGNTENSGWRTLTSDEWKYLFTYHTHKKAVINTGSESIKGMILFPDNYSGGTPEGVIFDQGSDFSTSCTLAGWTALEAAGCVFLPAAGYRAIYNNGPALEKIGLWGSYWSSSCGNSNSKYNAKYIYFYDSQTQYDQKLVSRSTGLSVRLVTE
jgi:hypothetical protein